MKRILVYTIFVFNIALVLYFWWQGNSMTFGLDSAETLMSLGRLAGLLLVLAIMTQFVFMSRAPWIERAFGFDRLAHAHRINGYFSTIFLVLHPIFLIIGYAMVSGVSYFEQYQDFVFNYEDVLPASIASFILIAIIFLSIYIVRRGLKYETWYFAHLGVYLVVLLSFGHQLNVGQDLSHSLVFRYYWLALYILVFSTFVIYRFLRPLFNFYKHRFYVSKIVRETDNVTSVYISGRNLSSFKVTPGQFMILRFLKKGFFTQAHPFSLSMTPKNNELRVSIKNSGDFTARIHEIPVGVPIIIDGPHGIFTEKLARKEKFLFIAGGIGITPIRAMLEAMANNHDCILIYANKTESDVALRNEIEIMPIKIFHVMSNDPNFNGEKGYVSGELIARLAPDFKNRSIYICGPPLMMKMVVHELIELGADKKDIHFEKFEL